jgi:hypothetical protein
MLRRVLVAMLLYALLGPLPGSLRAPHLDDTRVVTVRSVPVPDAGLRFGPFALAEAWEMSSANPRFGGFSGLAITTPRRFVAVSDAGSRLRFGLRRAAPPERVRWDQLPLLRANQSSKRFIDAEAITHDPVGGRSWVALEGIDQIWRFDAAGRRTGQRIIAAMRRWPGNGGAESLARMPNGRFITISERQIRAELHEGILFTGDPVAGQTRSIAFRYTSGALGSVTDIAALPDGRILILHRKLGLSPVFTSSIALADPRRLKPGGLLVSRPLAVIRDPHWAENYEGMTVVRDADSLSLWLISDDNQNDWQATRLLRLRFDIAAFECAKTPGSGARSNLPQ